MKHRSFYFFVYVWCPLASARVPPTWHRQHQITKGQMNDSGVSLNDNASPASETNGAAKAPEAIGSPTNANGTAAPAPTANELKEQANDLYKRGKYAEAVDLYTEAYELEKNPTFLLNRAASYLMMRAYHDALRDAERVMDGEPTNSKAIVRSAKAMCGLGRVEDAVRLLKHGRDLCHHQPAAVKDIEREVCFEAGEDAEWLRPID